ncbi:hypothetical protein [Duganella sp. S19_KUP01_CR8]|uniref:hypothetical protein n=1 Tax=Duganella sp. S19_KUP01_CR8 TaxID=3025502 RepID=UPI002FCD8EB5
MSLSKFFLVVAIVLTPIFGFEQFARYQLRERIRGIEQVLKVAAVTGRDRSAVAADLDRAGVASMYSDKTHAIYGRIIVGRFMFIYDTELSFVIHFGADDHVTSTESGVFHEGL